jgi:hypothetical protein
LTVCFDLSALGCSWRYVQSLLGRELHRHFVRGPGLEPGDDPLGKVSAAHETGLPVVLLPGVHLLEDVLDRREVGKERALQS